MGSRSLEPSFQLGAPTCHRLLALAEPPVENMNDPRVVEVLAFEDLPVGSLASQRAVVRWSDGTEGEALRWYADEVLSPVEHVRAAVTGLKAGNSAS